VETGGGEDEVVKIGPWYLALVGGGRVVKETGVEV